jgi:hypothetical protein
VVNDKRATKSLWSQSAERLEDFDEEIYRGGSMTDQELFLLTHPEEWPHGVQLPVVKRGGNPVRHPKDAGIVLSTNLQKVWTDVYLGDGPLEGVPLYYNSPEHLLTEWEID